MGLSAGVQVIANSLNALSSGSATSSGSTTSYWAGISTITTSSMGHNNEDQLGPHTKRIPNGYSLDKCITNDMNLSFWQDGSIRMITGDLSTTMDMSSGDAFVRTLREHMAFVAVRYSVKQRCYPFLWDDKTSPWTEDGPYHAEESRPF